MYSANWTKVNFEVLFKVQKSKIGCNITENAFYRRPEFDYGRVEVFLICSEVSCSERSLETDSQRVGRISIYTVDFLPDQKSAVPAGPRVLTFTTVFNPIFKNHYLK